MSNGTADPAAVTQLRIQQMQAANPQATRQARRLHIGNMPSGLGLTEQMLLEFFNTAVVSLGVMTPQPVVSVWLSAEGSYCFVELRAVRDATACLILLTGLTLGGRVLKIGRPSDYVPPPAHLENFIVGLPSESYKAPDPSQGGAVGLLGLSIGSSFGMGLPGLTLQATEVLMLVNMVTEADLADEEDFADIVLDVREECEKYGEVVSVVIPRPEQPGCADPEGRIPSTNDSGPRVGTGVGRVFVKFVSSESCTKAREVLDERMFNNKRVGATFYDVAKFESKVYA